MEQQLVERERIRAQELQHEFDRYFVRLKIYEFGDLVFSY